MGITLYVGGRGTQVKGSPLTVTGLAGQWVGKTEITLFCAGLVWLWDAKANRPTPRRSAPVHATGAGATSL